MNPPADNELEPRIRQLCRIGYQHLDEGDARSALRHFFRAWTLLPLPQAEHKASGWVLTAIGDGYLAQQRHALALESFRSAACCTGSTDNPLIRFKIGQCLYELGQTREAGSVLAQALATGGERVFRGQHGKYLSLARLHRDPV